MKPESMDNVFGALASPLRRKLLDLIKDHPGRSVSELSEAFDVSRIAITKHLGVLAESQLIVVRKNGRRREIYFNVVPIQLIYDRWTSEYSGFWASKVVDLKAHIENSLSEQSTTVATSTGKKRITKAAKKSSGKVQPRNSAT